MSGRATNSGVCEHRERCSDGGDDGRDPGDVQSLRNEVEPAGKGRHNDDEGEHLAEYRHPSDRAIVATAIYSVFFRHSDNALSKSGDNGIELGKFFRFRKRSNPQLAALRDKSLLPALLELVSLRLLELAFPVIPFRQARRLQTAAEAVSAPRWRSWYRWQP